MLRKKLAPHYGFASFGVMIKLRSHSRFGNALFELTFEILELEVPAVEAIRNHTS